MKLFAQHHFTVVRQIADHTDVTTYYVRAVIRNAYTDEIIDTLDLENKGSQRFKKNWRVPADPSEEGFYISIVTSVYTDSDYTTKSELYGDEEQTYLVEKKQISRGGGGGLIGRDVRDILVEELEKFAEKNKPKEQKPIIIPKQKQYDDQFKSLNKVIADLEKKLKPEKVDIAPILKALAGLEKLIEAIEIPKLDLSPVLDAIKDQLDTKETSMDDLKEIVEEVAKNIIGQIKKSNKDISTQIKSTNFVTSFITHAVPGKPPVDENEENEVEPPHDLSKLMGKMK